MSHGRSGFCSLLGLRCHLLDRQRCALAWALRALGQLHFLLNWYLIIMGFFYCWISMAGWVCFALIGIFLKAFSDNCLLLSSPHSAPPGVWHGSIAATYHPGNVGLWEKSQRELPPFALSTGAGMGWDGLGWAGMGWAGMGWIALSAALRDVWTGGTRLKVDSACYLSICLCAAAAFLRHSE